jgi:hypothetical protein
MKPRLIAAVSLVLLAACTALPVPTPTRSPAQSPTATPTPSPTAAAEVTQHVWGLSFVTPASWHLVEPRVWTYPVGPRLFLSSAAIADPCPSVFLQAQCLKPLAELPPGGILVTFGGSATLNPPNPTPIPIALLAGGLCAEIGGERELRASFPGFGVTACLRGPDLAANDAAFRRLVASISRYVSIPGD